MTMYVSTMNREYGTERNKTDNNRRNEKDKDEDTQMRAKEK